MAAINQTSVRKNALSESCRKSGEERKKTRDRTERSSSSKGSVCPLTVHGASKHFIPLFEKVDKALHLVPPLFMHCALLRAARRQKAERAAHASLAGLLTGGLRLRLSGILDHCKLNLLINNNNVFLIRLIYYFMFFI